MPTRCQDCNASFLLDGTTVVNGISCPDCGSTKLERDQPSPTRSDGEVRDMVDPSSQLDQGGNPLQEGVWAGVDGGWQPAYRRDESFASVKVANEAEDDSLWMQPSGIAPQHHQEAVVPDPGVGIHNGNLFWLNFLDAHLNGESVRENHAHMFAKYGMKNSPHFGEPVTVSVHDPSHMAAAIEAAQSPHLRVSKQTLAHAPAVMAAGKGIMAGTVPAPPGIVPPTQQAPVMSNHYDRALSMEPYLPWYHQADVTRYPAGGEEGRGDPRTLTNDEWAADKKQRYQDRQRAQGGHRLEWQPGQAGRGIMVGSQLHTWPVNKTMDDPQGGLMHGEYLQHLGVNPANVDVKSGFEINPDGSVVGGVPPEAPQIDPNLHASQEGFADMFAHTKESIAPLILAGGRMLLGKAVGGLMKKAIGGAGNHLNTAPAPDPYNPQVGLVAAASSIAPEVWEALGSAEPALEHYMQSDESGADDPSIAHLLEVIGQHHPEILEYAHGDQKDPEVEGLLDQHLNAHQASHKTGGLVKSIFSAGGALLGGAAGTLLGPEGTVLGAMAGRAIGGAVGGGVGGMVEKGMGGGGGGAGAPAPINPYNGPRPTALLSSERLSVGHDAPVETPGSTPRLINHDPETVDPSEFSDQSDDSNLENPNKDDLDGGLSQSTGEDATEQKLQFREDGDGVSQAELLLPLILQYIESPESGLNDPQLKALHETLEKEIPGYLDHSDEEDEHVHKLLEELKKPDHVTAAGVFQNTPMPMAQGQMPMQGQGQQLAMPGTHQNPIQPGGMPVDGKCINCGGVVNADGSCPQCGAAAGANQQGNMQAAPQAGQQTAPPGFMRPAMGSKLANNDCPHCHMGPVDPQSGICYMCNRRSDPWEQEPWRDQHTMAPPREGPNIPQRQPQYAATEHSAADHQGPITPQQKEVFAQYLIDQGRPDEVAAMMGNPALYADEWAQYINKSTQPPEVDPSQQPPPPPVDPSQMGQMPVPGMSIPQPTAHRTADNAAPRCPKCDSATTSIMSGDGECRCHRCGNIWTLGDFVKDKPDSIVSKRTWIVKNAYPDTLNNDSPNPVAAPAAEQNAPVDREQQQDSTLSWQDNNQEPLQVGQTYEMHSTYSPIPDMVKVQQVKPDSITVTMEGEYNSPSDTGEQAPQGPEYTHELDLNEAQAQGLTFNVIQSGDDGQDPQEGQPQDGIGQTVNTEPTRVSPEVPTHASVKVADLNKDVPEGGTCKVCGNALDSPAHQSGCSAAKLSTQHVGYGGPMVQDDPTGQRHVGETITYNSFGRTVQGQIVGFQPALARDPFVQTPNGDVKVISRRDIIDQPTEHPTQIQPPSVQAVPAPGQVAASTVPTDHCPECQYGHVTSSYNSPTEIQYECFRCAHQWKVADLDEGSVLAEESRTWLNEDSGPSDFNFDRVQGIEAALGSKGRNIRDIAAKDPRHEEIRERLNKNAGAKFSPREQKEFIDEEGTARNADRLNLGGTHYVESGFDNSKARPDRVNDAYLGLGL